MQGSSTCCCHPWRRQHWCRAAPVQAESILWAILLSPPLSHHCTHTSPESFAVCCSCFLLLSEQLQLAHRAEPIASWPLKAAKGWRKGIWRCHLFFALFSPPPFQREVGRAEGEYRMVEIIHNSHSCSGDAHSNTWGKKWNIMLLCIYTHTEANMFFLVLWAPSCD